MGNKQYAPILSLEEIPKYFNPNEMQMLNQEFKRLAKNGNKIDKNTFVSEVLSKRFDKFGDLVVQRLFAIFDLNGNGTIELEEFVYTIFALFKASTEDKYKLGFYLFDLDGNGQVSKKEFKRVLLALMQGDAKENQTGKMFSSYIDIMVDAGMKTFDRNADGTLSYGEWRRYASEDELVNRLIARMPTKYVLKDGFLTPKFKKLP